MDILAEDLTELGYEITVKTLRDDGIEGTQFVAGDVELTYRIVDDGETVLLSMLRRIGGKSGVRSSFSKLIWFVGYLSDNRERLGFKRFQGLVRADAEAASSPLPTERIMQFYRRLFDVYTLKKGYTGEWICIDLEKFKYPARSRPNRA